MLSNYRNEAAFSKAFVTALRNKGWFVQRIESGETGKGIPDIYAVDPNKKAHWFELKRVKHPMGNFETIPWRTGQQSWLSDIVKRGQDAKTICCFNDGILVIPHDRVYTANLVQTDWGIWVRSIQELLK